MLFFSWMLNCRLEMCPDMTSCLLLLVFLAGPVLGTEKSKVVTTVHGKVEGALSDFGDYYEFLGMRYGIPVKFRAPTEPPFYEGVFKADARNVACAQPTVTLPFGLPSNNADDCLVVNVFTPANFTKTSSLPVLVFIHGGGFGYGSSTPSFYGPRYLVSQGAIVVTFNYRLNLYGFLNLGIKEAPGNAGLKDQRAALRWVKNNIAQFGGNPENVTVFGHGAGGTSAIYLTLSPTTKGLFKNIIVESGSIFTKNSFDSRPVETAEVCAYALGKKGDTPETLFEIFATTPVEEVMEVLASIPESNSLFCPSVETIFEDEEAFLIDTPYNILATGLSHTSFNPVPVMIGQTTSEVLFKFLDGSISARAEEIVEGDISSFFDRNLEFPSSSDAKTARDLLKTTYLGNRTDYESAVGAIINFDTDFLYTGPISLFADMYTNNSKLPVYNYIFEHIGERNLGRKLLQLNNTVAGTTHYDELFYLMELESSPLPMTKEDAVMTGILTTIWTNFAKYGTPFPPDAETPWMPHPYVLSLTNEAKYVAPLTPDRANFWRGLYFMYGSDIRRA